MNTARFEFKESLQDFTGQKHIKKSFHLNPSAKDMIESCGVPQVEIFGLTANGSEVSMAYNVEDGDELTVYPKQGSDQSYPHQNIRAAKDLPEKFIADVHLGKLSGNLRLLGFDTLYRNDADDVEIVDTSVRECRSALTRDIGLLKHGRLKYGYWLRSTDPDEQLREVIDYFDLHNSFDPFSLCLNCNGILQPVNKAEVSDLLPPLVKENFEDFMQCENCSQVYWKGTHYMKLVERVKQLTNT